MNKPVVPQPRDLGQIAARLAQLPAEKQRIFLRRLIDNGISPGRLPIVVLPRAERPPLSYAQSRLWFLWKLDSQSEAYNLHNTVRLTGRLDRAALQRAFDELVRRHESLRTVFGEENSEPYQRILAPATVALPLHDFSELPSEEREIAAHAKIESEAGRPFDLGVGPLLRVALLRQAEQEHLLSVTMHHIISDGWSMEIAVGEFLRLYAAFSRGETSSLPLPSAQYVDYAMWQRSLSEAGGAERELAYWKDKLAGEAPALDLPLDFPQPALRSGRGANLSFHLDGILTEALKKQAAAQGASLFMLLLTALKVLLFRYSGQTDLRIGAPSANRDRVETEDVIGFFVNTLVLRSHVDGRLRFTELLAAVRKTVLDAQAHQDLPFEQLVEALQPERSLSSTPLFQVMYNHLRDQADVAPSIQSLRLEAIERELRAVGFDLALDTAETASGELYVSFAYATDLFRRATLERMRDHFIALLRHIAVAPETRICELALLSPVERQLIASWNVDAGASVDTRFVHRAIAREAALRPDEPALMCGSDMLTRGELAQRANRLAHRLIAHGVGPDVLVGVALERSVSLVVALLAILEAGGAYVPLDPEYPDERLRYMMDDAGIGLLITHSALRDRLPPAEGVFHLYVDQLELDSESDQTPAVDLHPDNLAYLIYTSGSTGRPKGVAVSHGPLAMHCMAIGARYEMSARDRELIFMSFSFDGAHERWLTALTHGASVVIRDSELWTPAQTLAAVHRYGVTVAALPPAYLQQLAEEAERKGNPPPVRVYCFAGDAVPQASFEQVKRVLRPDFIVNGYGPTETVVTPLIWKAGPEAQCGAVYAPIGDRVGARSARVLDADLNEVPIGVAGELYLGGLGLARGYHGRPGLTAERFLPDPFDENGGRLYRTGDRASQRPDGVFDYLGRVDHQVKIRGFRIELGEIESCLDAHEAVREALVVARETPTGKQLVGYVAGDAPELATTLRDYLKGRVPDYMVPAQIVVLDRLPVNDNGKIDRKALPDPQWRSCDPAPPRTPMECRVADIWRDVLGVEDVGVTDHFFELGGHSLLAIRVVSRIEASLGLPVAMRTLFETPTLGEFAAALDRLSPSAETPPPLLAGPRPTSVPLSFAQGRLWVLWQLDPQSAAYNIPVALRLVGGLNVAALTAAANELVRRHESLRTTFVMREGNPCQEIASSPQIAASYADLSHLARETRETEALRRVAGEARLPFNLAEGPLLRVLVLDIGNRPATDEREHVVIFTLHHITSDGWSADILVQEFTVLYEAFHAGQPSPLQELSIQYADYAVWQRNWLNEDVLARQIAYWQDKLAGAAPALELPTDRPRPAVQDYAGATYNFVVRKEVADRLRSLGNCESATLFMVLLTGFKLLLSRYTGQFDISVGTPVANRCRVELESLVGVFVNTLVLRTDLSGDPTFRALLARVRETALGAQAHQDLPFERLVEELQPVRDTSRSPLFQAMFDLETAAASEFALTGLRVEPLEIGTATAKFDLSLDITETDDALLASIEYATALFDARTIEQLAQHYCNLLETIGANPESRISDVPVLSPEERRQLLVGWNDTAHDFDDRCISQLFEDQAARSPHSIAVVFADQDLTYGELNASANRLARQLQSQGVGPETIVGLCVERSVDMMVGLLGILKAGGAYLPLDPDHPQERLAFMLADAGALLLLTQERLEAALPELSIPVLCLDRDAWRWASESGDNPITTGGPANLAYVIYTSGSTGRPKGVMVTQVNLVNMALTQAQTFGLTASDRVLQFSSISFDQAGEEIFPTWLSGGALVLLPRRFQDIAVDFIEFVNRSNVTVLPLTTAYWHFLTAEIAASRSVSPSGLRRVFVGGEKASSERLRTWRASTSPSTGWINTYGPTEATATSIAFTLPADWEGSREVPIGRPISNTKLYILDQFLHPTPIGVSGELYIGGAGLSRGYLGRPGLTAQRFVPNPFAEEGERLYRTGDFVRYREDGNIEFLDRLDQQVKIRGFRIELGEIEARLREHKDVAEAVVLVRDAALGKQLVGYVVAGVVEGLVDRLKSHLRAALPHYMAPAHLVILPGLPLTINGKLDRAALPEPDCRADAREEPADEIETILAEIWAEVLEVSQVGVTDNFFDIGGDSIVSIQVVSRARQRGLVLSPRDLFQHQTVRELAVTLGREPVEAQTSVTSTGTAVDRNALMVRLPWISDDALADAYPLSPMQQGMLFHTIDAVSEHSASVLYINQVTVGIDGMDSERFEAAWTAAVAHHDALRTGFVWEGVAEPLQFVLRNAALPLRRLDWRGRKATPQMLEEAADYERRTPFDLTQPPLMRLLLIRLDENSWRLVWTYHHVLIDGWSSSRLIGDVLRYYRGEPLGSAVRYRDYIDWLQRQDAAVSEHFWRQRLTTLEEPTLLSGAVPPGRRGEGHQAVYTRLDEARTARLLSFAQEQRVTLNTVVQAAWLLLLQRYTGQRTVSFGATVAGRPAHLAGVEDMLGLFINTLPVIQTPRPEVAVGAWLRALQEENLAIRAHEHTPLADVQRWAGQAGRSLFDSIIVFENHPVDRMLRSWEDETLRFHGADDVGITNFTMDLMVTLEESGLEIEYMFLRDSFDQETVEGLRRHMEGLLDQLPCDAARPLGEFGLADAVERERLAAWNAPVPLTPAPEPVHVRIADLAAQRPEAPAIRCGDAVVTYGELDARARRLAGYLSARGVGPEIVVGVAMRRTPDLIVGLLAILKAGGAYVPLDSDYPADRLAYMMEDAGLGLLLTESGLRSRLPAPDGLPRLDIDAVDLSTEPDRPLPEVHHGNLAYLIYTSGSTGRPKGVAVSHGPLAMHCRAIGARYQMSPRDCELIFMSFSFDGAHERWLTALTHGACIAIRGDELWTPEQTFEALHRHGVTVAAFPPAYLQQLAGHAERTADAPPVRVYCFGGDAVPRASFDLAQRALRPEFIVNGYGPTETVVTPMIWKAGPDDRCAAAYAPIGDRVGARSIWVLDADLNPLPPGVAGVLYIGGEGLARGYHRRAGLTAERFVPDPFDVAGGGRFYCTGDLVRQRPDGLIDCLGRVDHQVKIRGFRIELGEVEARLAEHPAVREAAVVARETEAGRQLVGYVAADREASADLLRAYLAARLPAYMVPAQLVVLERLPLNSNGKVDRSALPDPLWRQRDHVAPQTAQERRLAAIWQEVLGVDVVGVTDNFFELGGDSILTLKVIARVRGQPELGLDLRLRDLMRKPTIAQLCGAQAPASAAPDPLITLNGGRAGHIPLFCLHAGFGTVFDYEGVVKRLGGDVPIHGLQCRMLLDPAWRDVSIVAMAQDYAKRIREAQPEGPYRLLGWSLGGALAMLVARALEDEGQRVSFVGLVDPFVPAEAGDDGTWRDELADFLQFTLPQAGPPDACLLEGVDEERDLGALEALIARHMFAAPVRAPAGASYAALGAAELAQIFAVAGRLRALSAVMPPLSPTRVVPTCWWLPGREAARELLRGQTVCPGEERVIDATHFDVLHAEDFLDSLAPLLMAPGMADAS